MEATSPISNLNSDTFLAIFDLITSQIPDRYRTARKNKPLIVVQNASQVCRQWRELLLGSSWIWGRLMDMCELIRERIKVEWFEEVFRRAGLAALWIYGSVLVEEKTQARLFRLFDSWERIEKLVVLIISFKDMPEEIHARFSAPAPILKTFDVSLDANNSLMFFKTLKSGISESLFADHAPSLREMRADLVAFRLNSPWLSNIREIKYFPPNMPLNDIFIILQHTPVIETIILQSPHLVWKQADTPRHKLSLPRLSSIKMSTNFEAAARILDFILPGSLSMVYIDIERVQNAELHGSGPLSGFKQNFARFFTNYFTTNPPQTVLIELMPGNLQFCDVTHCTRQDVNKPYFELKLSSWFGNRGDSFSSCVIDMLTDSFSPNTSVLECIHQLRLPRLAATPLNIPRLYSLLALFRNVQVIKTDTEQWTSFCDLSALDDSGGDPHHVLFPIFHTLEVGRYKRYERAGEALYTCLTRYITGRNRLGFPLAKLDLTRCKNSYHEEDIFRLETVEGLEVTWIPQTSGHSKSDEVRSYVCGTGKPRRLQDLIKCHRYY